jgi:hypothetical protein
MAGRMGRRLGPLLLVVLLLAAAGVRLAESTRAGRLLDGEAQARATLAELHRACAALAQDGRVTPDLAGRALAAVPGLRRLPDVSREAVAYATDGAFVYGLATQLRTDADTVRPRQGWILRAWPADFGTSGDREYQLADDGVLWEGQNRLGRSGTRHGFPPAFPEPDAGQPRAPWWTVPLPAHR